MHNQNTVASAYLHIPFCAKKCGYCDFVSYVGSESQIEAYALRLRNEILNTVEYYKRQGVTFSALETVYFGGGTPSLLQSEQICNLLATLDEAWVISKDAEITLEVNPDSWFRQSPTLLRQSGVNRISMGLQSYDDKLLKMLGRVHGTAQFSKAAEAIAGAGFEHFSSDIMLGLPTQTVVDVEATLTYLFDNTGIDHLSFYALQIEEQTHFAELYRRGKLALPSEANERQMYWLARDMAQARGFLPYEISNAAKLGAQSQHNVRCWQTEPYLGFGIGASSYINNRRYTNSSQLVLHAKTWEQIEATQAELAKYRGESEIIDPDEARRESMWLGYRMTDGVDFALFAKKHGVLAQDVFAKELESLNKKGLIELDEYGTRLTKSGIDFANEVFCCFV